ncbi:MAG: 30S ribosomal protein S8, partial [Candidatus Sumerlaeota bacterium]|nr:30S ribosomal protein S8 [Candidatus Sumerlaeota bacterium]
MSMTDPIADMLSRIRNANTAAHDTVEVPASRIKVALTKILREEGFIKHYKIVKSPSKSKKKAADTAKKETKGGSGRQGLIRIYMKYGPRQER